MGLASTIIQALIIATIVFIGGALLHVVLTSKTVKTILKSMYENVQNQEVKHILKTLYSTAVAVTGFIYNITYSMVTFFAKLLGSSH